MNDGEEGDDEEHSMEKEEEGEGEREGGRVEWGGAMEVDEVAFDGPPSLRMRDISAFAEKYKKYSLSLFLSFSLSFVSLAHSFPLIHWSINNIVSEIYRLFFKLSVDHNVQLIFVDEFVCGTNCT